jgi:hypothetical protein
MEKSHSLLVGSLTAAPFICVVPVKLRVLLAELHGPEDLLGPGGVDLLLPSELANALGGEGHHSVAFAGLMAHDFSCSGHFEPSQQALSSLHLRHFITNT